MKPVLQAVTVLGRPIPPSLALVLTGAEARDLHRWDGGLTPEAIDALRDAPVDVIRRSPQRTPWQLAVFDMDSTLIECEVIDELAKRAGVGPEVSAITERAMRGELEFAESYRARVALLRGLPEADALAIADNLPIMDGADRLFAGLRARGIRTAICSGGFTLFARRLQDRFKIDSVHANELEIVDGALTGHVVGEIMDGPGKAAAVRQIAETHGFDLAHTVAVGDGANDLPMIQQAGLGVAFRAKPIVRGAAHHAITVAGLDAILIIMGE